VGSAVCSETLTSISTTVHIEYSSNDLTVIALCFLVNPIHSVLIIVADTYVIVNVDDGKVTSILIAVGLVANLG